MLAFVTLPAVLFWIGYRRNSFWLALPALSLNCLVSAAIPILVGSLHFRDGRLTTRLRQRSDDESSPFFGHHVAPDGMDLLIHVLLVAALIAGVAGLRQIRFAQEQMNEASAG